MSEYDNLMILIHSDFDEIEESKKKFLTSAKDRIPALRDALVKERLDHESIKDRILKDCLQFWTRRTIMDALGDEFKDQERSETGKKGAEAKKPLVLTNDGKTDPQKEEQKYSAKNSSDSQKEQELAAMTSAKNSSDSQKEQESSTFESATERAKRLLQDVGYDVEEKEDQQIQINDLNTRIQTLEENDKRKSIALDKSYERIKELTEDKARLTAELEKKLSLRNVPNPNFATASDIVNEIKIDGNNNNEYENEKPIPAKYYKKVVGDLNTRILELKDKLLQTKIYKETIEIRGQRIVLDVKCSNLESIEIDELASRRLNQ